MCTAHTIVIEGLTNTKKRDADRIGSDPQSYSEYRSGFRNHTSKTRVKRLDWPTKVTIFNKNGPNLLQF